MKSLLEREMHLIWQLPLLVFNQNEQLISPLWSATLSWWWGLCTDDPDDFYTPQRYRQVLLRRVLAMGILSVCLSVCLSQPGGIPSPGEIETPGLHHMIAKSL